MSEIRNTMYTEKHIENQDFDEACRVFFNWKDSVSESANEYANRIKKVKILKIIKSIIENELSEKERQIMELKFFGEKNYDEVSDEVSVCRTTTWRSMQKIEHTLKEYLKYVAEYAELDLRNEVMPLVVNEAVACMAFCGTKPKSFEERLKKVRAEKCLTPEQVAGATGIEVPRYKSIEAGGGASVKELVKLALFFAVSADYLVFGI